MQTRVLLAVLSLALLIVGCQQAEKITFTCVHHNGQTTVKASLDETCPDCQCGTLTKACKG